MRSENRLTHARFFKPYFQAYSFVAMKDLPLFDVRQRLTLGRNPSQEKMSFKG